MYGFDFKRAGRVAAIGALLLSGACGGDNGTGPGGGGGGVGGNYQLIGVNDIEVPAVVQMEHCTPSRFTDGALVLDGNGSWQLAIELEDETGQHVLQDAGQFRRQGEELAFDSEAYGDRFYGEIDEGLVFLYYDFCSNGEHDIDFVFEK